VAGAAAASLPAAGVQQESLYQGPVYTDFGAFRGFGARVEKQPGPFPSATTPVAKAPSREPFTDVRSKSRLRSPCVLVQQH
jgi:hypothetical protein